MSVAFEAGGIVLHQGDCIEVMRSLPDAGVDAVVTDPPYGISFMGKAWDAPGAMLGQISGGDRSRGPLPSGPGANSRGFADHDGRMFQRWCEEWAAECFRVLKPGGHLLAFGASRGWHRLAVGIEDAGFEIRDSIAWLYGSGFPKSLDVSSAIDKLDASAERTARAREFQLWLREHLTPKRVNELTGTDMGHHLTTHPSQPSVATADLFDLLRPELPEVPERIEQLVAERTIESANFAAREVTGKHRAGTARGAAGFTVAGEGKERRDLAFTDEARAWEGWGTALKPAFEPIVVARKPLVGTVAANVLAYGTGAINIDATRVEAHDDQLAAKYASVQTPPGGVVLEPFAGSGTTVEACLREGFGCIAIEREADYIPLILQRVEKPHEVSLFGDLFEDGDAA